MVFAYEYAAFNEMMISIIDGRTMYYAFYDMNFQYTMAPTGITYVGQQPYIGQQLGLSALIGSAQNYVSALKTQINNLGVVNNISSNANSSIVLNQLTNLMTSVNDAQEVMSGSGKNNLLDLNTVVNALNSINVTVQNSIPSDSFASDIKNATINTFTSWLSQITAGSALVVEANSAYSVLQDIVKSYYSKLASIQQNVETTTATQRVETGMTPNDIRRRQSSIGNRDYLGVTPSVGTLQILFKPLVEPPHNVATSAEINANLPPNRQKKF